jgi:hypothetical protein
MGFLLLSGPCSILLASLLQLTHGPHWPLHPERPTLLPRSSLDEFSHIPIPVSIKENERAYSSFQVRKTIQKLVSGEASGHLSL